MNHMFSDRITDVPRSFIREILKVALDKTIISFAGGLPNRELFPSEDLKNATQKVFEKYGNDVFQYSNSEGFLGLRELISQRYKEKRNLDIPVDNIIITSGSQQGLDLLGKVFINDGDDLIIEEPGYLGAIQAFSIYKPHYLPVKVNDNGLDVDAFKKVMSRSNPKLMYTVPNFQNPAGITYSESNRRELGEIIDGTNTLLIEDDPYGELRYTGKPIPSFKSFIPNNTILLGSFSKTVVPGFRIGWIAAPDDIIEKVLIAKQASDLHTSHFTQCIIYEYIKNFNVDSHISIIKERYGNQLKAMLGSIDEYFPSEVACTRPEGGMFLWVTLPGNLSSRALLDIALKDKVIFVPGDPFYIKCLETNTLRLNFSCVDEETVKTGMKRLGHAIEILLK